MEICGLPTPKRGKKGSPEHSEFVPRFRVSCPILYSTEGGGNIVCFIKHSHYDKKKTQPSSKGSYYVTVQPRSDKESLISWDRFSSHAAAGTAPSKMSMSLLQSTDAGQLKMTCKMWQIKFLLIQRGQGEVAVVILTRATTYWSTWSTTWFGGKFEYTFHRPKLCWETRWCTSYKLSIAEYSIRTQHQ